MSARLFHTLSMSEPASPTTPYHHRSRRNLSNRSVSSGNGDENTFISFIDGYVIGITSLAFSTLTLVMAFIAVPMLISKLYTIKHQMQMEMTGFKTESDRLWNDMMHMQKELRTKRQSVGFQTASSNQLPPGFIPFPFQKIGVVTKSRSFGQKVSSGPPGYGEYSGGGISSLPPGNAAPSPQSPGSASYDGSTTKEAGGSCQGPPGLPGLDGIDGEDGRPGDDGPQGRDANELFDSYGEEEDCQICPPGPAGQPGKYGPPGAPGLIGPKGRPGIDGLPGQNNYNSGPPGATGPPGRDGNIGYVGPPGKDVIAGRGQRGPPGVPGPIGAIGLPGKPGRSSDEIIIGEPGPDGPIGLPGNPGAQGLPGIEGPRGEPGIDASYCPCTGRTSSYQPLPPPVYPTDGSSATASGGGGSGGPYEKQRQVAAAAPVLFRDTNNPPVFLNRAFVSAPYRGSGGESTKDYRYMQSVNIFQPPPPPPKRIFNAAATVYHN